MKSIFKLRNLSARAVFGPSMETVKRRVRGRTKKEPVRKIAPPEEPTVSPQAPQVPFYSLTDKDERIKAALEVRAVQKIEGREAMRDYALKRQHVLENMVKLREQRLKRDH